MVTSASDITYCELCLHPDKTTQSHKHIRGWIDIVGFEQTVKMNGTMYSNQSEPIIMYDIWDAGLIWNDNFDWIKVTDDRYYFDGNNTVAEIDIHLLWHHSSKRCRTVTTPTGSHTYCWIHKDYYHEYVTFSKTVPIPTQYPALNIPQFNVTVFNDSIAPKTTIRLQDIENLLGYKLNFNNESVKYYFNVLSVEEMDNGLPYGNFTPVQSQSIYEDSEVFSRVGNTILINSTEIDDSLKIYAITPYEKIEVNYTISNYSSGPGLTKMEMSSLFSILIMGWFIVFLIKRMRM